MISAVRVVLLLIFGIASIVTVGILAWYLVSYGQWPIALILIGVIGIIAFEDELPEWATGWTTWGDGTTWGRWFDHFVWVLWITVTLAAIASVVFEFIYS